MQKIGEIAKTKSGNSFIVDDYRKDSFDKIIMITGRRVKKDKTIDKRFKSRDSAYTEE